MRSHNLMSDIVAQVTFSVGVPDEEVVELQQRWAAEGFSEALTSENPPTTNSGE